MLPLLFGSSLDYYFVTICLVKRLKKLPKDIAIRIYLLTVVIGFGLTLFAYIAVQQSLRLSLNQPQLQIAQDTAQELEQGESADSVVPKNTVNEAISLSPFVTVVDGNIRVLASSGKIGNQVPLPPASTFPDSQKRSTNWFTWQHDNYSVRDAAVIVPFSSSHGSGYVLVARSTSQTEAIIGHITVLAIFTLLGIVLASAIIIFVI